MRWNWGLIILVILAAYLRLWQLDKLPVGLHGDEVSIGYNAYSLFRTGKDQNGHFLPLVIDQFGDFRPPGYHYLTVPFVATLGLSAWAVRLPAALAGIIMVPVLFFLVSRVLSRPAAFLTVILLTLSPWHINISRATSEGVVAMLLLLLGLWATLKARDDPRGRKWWILAAGAFGLSLLFYHSVRLFLPVWMPIWALILVPEKKKRSWLGPVSGLSGLVVVFVLFLLTAGRGGARPADVSILNVPGGDVIIRQQIGEDAGQHVLLTRFFHNKLVFYGRLFASGYFLHLFGDFLFVNTGAPIRYLIPWTGNLYMIELPFILLGFAVCVVDSLRQRKARLLLPVLWVLVGAIPAGLTWEDVPNVQRASLMLPGIWMLGSLGVGELAKHLPVAGRGKWVWAGIAGAFLVHAAFFYHNYFHHGRVHEPWHRSGAAPELVFVLNELAPKYRKVYMTTQGNNNYIHHLFYRKFDPAKFQALGSPREQEGLVVFDNIQLTANRCPLGNDRPDFTSQDPEDLYVNIYHCKLPVNAKIIKTVYQPDGTGAYQLLVVDPEMKPEIPLPGK